MADEPEEALFRLHRLLCGRLLFVQLKNEVPGYIYRTSCSLAKPFGRPRRKTHVESRKVENREFGKTGRPVNRCLRKGQNHQITDGRHVQKRQHSSIGRVGLIRYAIQENREKPTLAGASAVDCDTPYRQV